ncbi:hypothetical protein [Candidatus Berkiella aquae]|uniref:Ankyrin repeats (3 copies) n=1 Tax=Candidatus Berkiella aquae TaxID=295108 RepID=A0A0Q9YV50_9GAMM|nr:hypothetical protein [Candidatus Berkiella aquae]MCS5710664.1 hypothetical protein [Candidatus Berkiella aquae]
MRKKEKVYAAVENNSLTELKGLLSNDHTTYYDVQKGNLLLVAVKAGHADIVEYLVKREEEIYYRSKNHTALRAYESLKPSSIEELINITELKENCYQKLYSNIHLHRWDKIEEVKQSPLIEAIKRQNLPVIKAIVQSSLFFEASFKDTKGNTPLHYVGKIKDASKRKEIAVLLIKKGMDITLRNDKDELPCHYEEFEETQNNIKRGISIPSLNRLFFRNNIHSFVVASIAVVALLLMHASFPIASIFGIIGAIGYHIANVSHQISVDRYKLAQQNQLASEVFYQLDKKSDKEITQYLQNKNMSLTEIQSCLRGRVTRKIVTDNHLELAGYLYQNNFDLIFALAVIFVNPTMMQHFANKGAALENNPYLTPEGKQESVLKAIDILEKRYKKTGYIINKRDNMKQKFDEMRKVIELKGKRASSVTLAFNMQKRNINKSTPIAKTRIRVEKTQRARR